MKTFLSFLAQPAAAAFGWTLLHALWQGIIVAFGAALFFYVARQHASRLRYWVGVGALGLQAAASVATFWVCYRPAALAPSALPLRAFVVWPNSEITHTLAALPWHKQVFLFLQTNLPSVVIFWLIGASVLLVRLIFNWIYAQQIKTSSTPTAPQNVVEAFLRISHSLHIKQSVRLLESLAVATPMVIGWFKPVVLLPVGLTSKQLEAVLAHELAHIKRHDYAVNLLQSLVETIYFFHPALWWLSERVRAERENCCDDLAVGVCGSRLALAQALALVEQHRQMPTLAMGLGANKMALLQRIKRILGVSESSKRQKSNVSGLLLVVFLLVGASVYGLQEVGKEKTPKAKKAIITKSLLPQSAPAVYWGALVPSEKELQQIVDKALSEAQPTVDAIMAAVALSDTAKERDMTYHSLKIDSLSRLMSATNQKSEALQLEMEQYRFKVEELERKPETIEWKKQRVQEERSKVLEKRNRTMYPENQKIKKNEAEVEKELADYEQQIKTQEQQLTELNRQKAELNAQIETAQQPLDKLELQIEKINQENGRLSEQMSQHGIGISGPIEISMQMSQQGIGISKQIKVSLHDFKYIPAPRAAKKAAPPKPAVAPAAPPRPPKPQK